MAPTLTTSIRGLLAAADLASKHDARDTRVEVPNRLMPRGTSTATSTSTANLDPSAGVLDPHDIKNLGFFVLFALIGVGFVVTGIWFFFWAKNGGFHFKENDWDDYKTTVLRRKGPNGTLLSGATPSTNLGGGSVYKDVEDDGKTTITDSTGMTGITAGASDIAGREKRRKKQEQRDRERRKKRGTARRHVGEDGVQDDNAEKEAKQHLRDYRHERPARVGGLNKQSEGSQWDGSTNPTASEMTDASTELLLNNRQSTPTSTPTATPTKKHGGIRKVYSSADRTAERETERIRAEAKRLREAGRSAAAAGGSSSPGAGISRRDFSYQRAANTGEGSSVTESLLTGSDVGTKSYHHPMPELREQREKEREDRRARRGGYRRGRTEDI